MKRRRVPITLLLACALAVLLSACGVLRPEARLPLEGIEWKLIKMDAKPPVEGTPLTVTFQGESASGSAGCNRFSGAYERMGTGLKIGPLMSTMMACEQRIMEQEALFMRQLGAAQTFRIADGKLIINVAGGETLTFVPNR